HSQGATTLGRILCLELQTSVGRGCWHRRRLSFPWPSLEFVPRRAVLSPLAWLARFAGTATQRLGGAQPLVGNAGCAGSDVLHFSFISRPGVYDGAYRGGRSHVR